MLLNLLIFGVPITLVHVSGVFIAFIGVLITISKGNIQNLYNFEFNYGDLLIFIAVIMYACYSLSLKFKPEMSWISFLFALCLSASIGSVPFFIYDILQGQEIVWSQRSIWIILYVATLASIFAQLFFAKGISIIGANKASVTLNFIPIFGTFMAIIIVGEMFYIYNMISLILVILGVYMTIYSKK